MTVVERDDKGSIATLALNRPEYNSWGADMASRLVGLLRDVDADKNIRVCILTGVGDKAFSSGANLKDESTHKIASVEDFLSRMRPMSDPIFFKDILTFRKPLICAVNGYAIGAGFQIALCCDVIFASSTAMFKLPQVSLGLLPAYGATARLAQWIGRGRAMEIALSGRFVDALEAERIGLVSRAVSPELLVATVNAFAGAVAGQPELSVALTKESLVTGMEDGLRGGALTDLYRFVALALTPESQERHASWRRTREDGHSGS
jgi:enoyl-CoA hydratase/carnithine racemase